MMSQLLFANIPHDCSDQEFKQWIQSRGVEVQSIRIIRDLVAGVSPAFAYATLEDYARLDNAVAVLNGLKIRNHVVSVRKVPQLFGDSSVDKARAALKTR